MKNYILLLCLTFSLNTLFAQTSSVSAEEEAIKKVIIDEGSAFMNSDLDTWAKAHIQKPYEQSFHKWTNWDATWNTEGWDKMYEGSKKSYGTPNFIAYTNTYKKVDYTNWKIQIREKVAWATYKTMNDMTDGSVLPIYNLKIMEKVNNEWKIAYLSGSTAPHETFSKEKQEEIIKKVINDESEHWMDGNYEKWSESFVHEPYLTWSVTNGNEPGDVLTVRGWDAFGPPNIEKFKNRKEGFAAEMRKSKSTRDKWNIQIRGNIAYVNFNAHVENEEKQSKFDSTEMRVLERINGKWKITMHSTLVDFKDATPPRRSKY